jgi:hypothetical protein
MSLTEEQKQKLDSDMIYGGKRLHLISHAEISQAIAGAL